MAECFDRRISAAVETIYECEELGKKLDKARRALGEIANVTWDDEGAVNAATLMHVIAEDTWREL